MGIAILAKIRPRKIGRRRPPKSHVTYVYKTPHMYISRILEESHGRWRKLQETKITININGDCDLR